MEHAARLAEWEERQKYSSRHSVDELNSIVNDDDVLLNPLDGICYSIIANKPDDVWKFIYRFTDQMVFVGYLLEEILEGEPDFDSLLSDEYTMLPERKFTSIDFNPYFDLPVEKVFYPDQMCEQYAKINFRLVDLPYPCAIQWVGENDFSFSGSVEKRLLSVIPLSNRDTFFVQAS